MAEIKGTVQNAPEEGTPEHAALLEKAKGMNIKPFTPHEKPGVYDDQVQTLIQVDEETGYQNSIEILVPEGEVKKHKRYFSTSAKKYDKTSRIVNGEEGVKQGDGRLLEFVLVPKVTRKPKNGDTPTEVPAA